MKQLDEMKWEAFFISEIFDFDKGNQNEMNTLSPGNTPLISAKKVDNGLKGFATPNQKKLFAGHCITLNLDGDGGAGLAYYQPSQMLLDSHVCALVPRYEISREALLFISRIITSQGDAYGHGHSINKNRLRVFRIMLPVSAPHTPDYAYMEEYMRNIEKEMLTKYQAYLDKRIFERRNEELRVDSRRWKEFYIGNVFTDILRGKRLKTDDHIEGSMPYVSSSSQNNGVDNFVSNTEGVRIFGNCLSLANSGSVGETFYHQYDFVASDHVTKLANKSLDKYAYLFISSVVRRISEKYGFNREINDKRLGREKIMLPVTSYSTPDYAFMSHYMRNLELKQLKTYIDKRLGNMN